MSALCALCGLSNAAAKPPFALARKWTFGKELDSCFRRNDEDDGGNGAALLPRGGLSLPIDAAGAGNQKGVPSGKRQAASGKRQAASGKRQAASGKRQAASDSNNPLHQPDKFHCCVF